jgi:hypothetical protein
MSTDRIALRAGPLTMGFDPASGWLRHVRLGGREVLRAVYPAVRDRFWNTLPTAVSNVTVEEAAGGFRLGFDARCHRGPIDFAFRGEVVGTTDGALTYRFDGEARSTFLRNRIGLCVLHPIAGCAGEPCEVEHTDGRVEQTRFPADVAPHQPFHDVRAITHAPTPDVRLEVRFDGDVFETEDQRNWTDASFKTYSTPLARPHPVEVAAGTTVRQAVTLRLFGSDTRPPLVLPEPSVALGGSPLPRLPRIGFGAADRPLTPAEFELLSALRPDHLRVDLTASDPTIPGRLSASATQAEDLGAGLEVAVLLGDDLEGDLRRLAVLVRAVRPRVRSWLVCRDRVGVAGAAELAAVRRHLGGYDAAARWGVGTNLYFTQLNRARPPLGDADFVGFSVNPQVHAFDDGSVVETLDGQSEVVANASRLAGGRAVAVTPVTLRPRFNPNGGADDGPDPRQAALFAAAWALGSVRRLAGAASVTYFETAGPRGLTDGGTVFPVYHVFADLAGVAGWAVDPGVCSRPLEVEGLVFRDGGRWVALVANLTARSQTVSLPFAAAGPARVRFLDETTADLASRDPAAFRADPGEPLAGGRLQLRPYAVARVEGAAS